MKDFALDENGDILMENRDIVYIRDQEQEIQKIRQVLGTRSGEWEHDPNEGIDFDALLQKQPDLQRIRETIQNALREVSERYTLQAYDYDVQNGILKIQVSAENLEPLEVYVPVNTKT